MIKIGGRLGDKGFGIFKLVSSKVSEAYIEDPNYQELIRNPFPLDNVIDIEQIEHYEIDNGSSR